MATLHYTLSVDGLEDDSLVVRGFEGQETLSDGLSLDYYGFRYEITLASRRPDLSPEQMVDMQAELKLYRNGELKQRVHGIIRQFTQGDIGHHHTFYSLTLVPALERLSLRHNSRIFQQKNVKDIITVLLSEMGVQEYAFSLTRSLPVREFCVQYRETDLAFVQRLAAEEGLVYSFEHNQGKHTILFSDSSESLPKLEAPIPYHNTAGGVVDEAYISGLQRRTQSETSEVSLQDYSFKKPDYSLSQTQHGTEMAYQREGYQHFDAPGRYKDDTSGKAFSQVRLDYLRREAHIATGQSNHMQIRAGVRFELQDHLSQEMNQDWVAVSVRCKGTQDQALEESGGEGATTYENSFTLIPATMTWRATPQPKPQVDGPMIALVVGPKGEEIYCDKHGRVKIHFPWDRYSSGDEHSSCWVRVSQGWAGAQYGMMAIPRIGHEVIVDFLNGDPDQPIIIGRTYYAKNTPPYVLPEHKTKTVLRSETHQGQGFNELSFEDQAESEKVYLHAQKDFEADILNDHTTHIKHDKHLTVENDHFTHIKNNHHLTVEGESRNKITKDQTLMVDGSVHIKTGKLWAHEAGGEVHLKAGQKVVIEAGSELTIKAGGSFVKVDASGVSLVGPAINLNSGGSAGSGSGFGGKVATLPLGITPPSSPEPVTLPVYSATQSAAFNALVKPCQQG